MSIIGLRILLLRVFCASGQCCSSIQWIPPVQNTKKCGQPVVVAQALLFRPAHPSDIKALVAHGHNVKWTSRSDGFRRQLLSGYLGRPQTERPCSHASFGRYLILCSRPLTSLKPPFGHSYCTRTTSTNLTTSKYRVVVCLFERRDSNFSKNTGGKNRIREARPRLGYHRRT